MLHLHIGTYINHFRMNRSKFAPAVAIARASMPSCRAKALSFGAGALLAFSALSRQDDIDPASLATDLLAPQSARTGFFEACRQEATSLPDSHSKLKAGDACTGASSAASNAAINARVLSDRRSI